MLQAEERFELAATATAEVIRPSLFGVGIITAAGPPIFALTGVEGKMFHPMAITVVLALVSAMAARLALFPPPRRCSSRGAVAEHENRALQMAHEVSWPNALLALVACESLAGDRRRPSLVAINGFLATRLGLRVRAEPR